MLICLIGNAETQFKKILTDGSKNLSSCVMMKSYMLLNRKSYDYHMLERLKPDVRTNLI